MQVFVTKRLAIALVLVNLVAVCNLGVATAQTTEEGIANYYSNRFQGRKTASGAQNLSFRNQGEGDQS